MWGKKSGWGEDPAGSGSCGQGNKPPATIKVRNLLTSIFQDSATCSLNFFKICGASSSYVDYLLGYNAVYFTKSQETFRRNVSPPSSASKNKPYKK
jgi:hypothetical protein